MRRQAVSQEKEVLAGLPRLHHLHWQQGKCVIYSQGIESMNHMTLLGMALAVAVPAAPALAQQTAPADPAPATASAPAEADATAAANNATQVAALVDKDFPTYDADKSGQLDKAEFSKWVLMLKDAELKASGKTMAQTDLAAWASAAFTSADSDKSATITKTELGKFLGA
jgi:hypothetical protein